MESPPRKSIRTSTLTSHDRPHDDDHCADSRSDDEPTAPAEDDEPSDLDVLNPTETNDADWDVFLADDDERDPLPEHGDFWESMERGARSEEPD